MNKILNINKKIVLASKSPRRKILLENLGLKFEIHGSEIDEDKIYNEDPAKYVVELAKLKAAKVSENFDDAVIIGADTTVYFEGKYLNKPQNFNEASSMLASLSNNVHYVYSGICVIDTGNFTLKTDYSVTEVKFRRLDSKEIVQYIEEGSPFDKAGAYGIQDDYGSVFVEYIRGDFYNVVGLPLVKLYQLLRELSS